MTDFECIVSYDQSVRVGDDWVAHCQTKNYNMSPYDASGARVLYDTTANIIEWPQKYTVNPDGTVNWFCDADTIQRQRTVTYAHPYPDSTVSTSSKMLYKFRDYVMLDVSNLTATFRRTGGSSITTGCHLKLTKTSGSTTTTVWQSNGVGVTMEGQSFNCRLWPTSSDSRILPKPTSYTLQIIIDA